MIEEFAKFLSENGTSPFSQLQQDKLVLFLHGSKPGYFVEFGACDGVYLSNTYLLESKYKWDGILCEPAPSYFESLCSNRGVHKEQLCVAAESGKSMQFVEVDYENDKGLSGLQDYVFQDHHSETRRNNSIVYNVDTISLKDLLDKYSAPEIIDYLSIDTEGSELSILEAYDFSRHFKIITVEHNGTHNRDKIYSLLTEKGYDRILPEVSAWDDWYIKKDLM